MDINVILAEAVKWVEQHPGASLISIVSAYLLLLILMIIQMAQSRRQARRQNRLMRGASGDNLEEMLLRHLDDARLLRAQMERTDQNVAEHSEELKHCLQRTGVVRYDAFSDITGRQSFSVAVLDRLGNGLVVSGITSRNDVHIYAKPVEAGRSPVVLSTEERTAIDQARSGVPTLVELGGTPSSSAR